MILVDKLYLKKIFHPLYGYIITGIYKGLSVSIKYEYPLTNYQDIYNHIITLIELYLINMENSNAKKERPIKT